MYIGDCRLGMILTLFHSGFTVFVSICAIFYANDSCFA